jgi:hypothetical protein
MLPPGFCAWCQRRMASEEPICPGCLFEQRLVLVYITFVCGVGVAVIGHGLYQYLLR